MAARPDKGEGRRGAIYVRMDPKLYEQIQKLATRERRSMSAQAAVMLQECISPKGGTP